MVLLTWNGFRTRRITPIHELIEQCRMLIVIPSDHLDAQPERDRVKKRCTNLTRPRCILRPMWYYRSGQSRYWA